MLRTTVNNIDLITQAIQLSIQIKAEALAKEAAQKLQDSIPALVAQVAVDFKSNLSMETFETETVIRIRKKAL